MASKTIITTIVYVIIVFDHDLFLDPTFSKLSLIVHSFCCGFKNHNSIIALSIIVVICITAAK